MSQSATPLWRSERMVATASRLTSVSRRLTVDHGLSGFTIEEVCAEVGVSRRTFFNYFPSKEEAVIGVDAAEELRQFAEGFLHRGCRGWAFVIDDLVELAIDHAHAAGFDTRAHAEFVAVLEREPKLIARVMGVTREREQSLVELVALREGVEPTDPLARASVTLLSAVLRTAADRLLGPDAPHEFARAIHDSLDAIRAVAATQNAPRKDHP